MGQDGSEFSGLSEAELLRAYTETVQRPEALDSVSAMSRLMDRRARIVAELDARDETLQALYALLDHPDPRVQHVTALEFRTIDHAAYERTVRALAGRDDDVGRNARHSLELDAQIRQTGYRERTRPGKETPPDGD